MPPGQGNGPAGTNFDVNLEDGHTTMTRKIGILSDTHGLLREEVRSRLQGCDTIMHAGDIGGLSVLEELRHIAEVVAVRGNVDTGAWARELPEMEYVDVEGTKICVIHDLSELALDPAAAGVNVVLYGHSHKPAAEWREDILYLNPGGAGPKRFHLPVSMAFLHIGSAGISQEIIELE